MKKFLFAFMIIAFSNAVALNSIFAGEKNSSNEQKEIREQKLDELGEQWKEKQTEKKEQSEKATDDWKQKLDEIKE